MIKTFNPSRDIKEQPSEITELNTYGGSIFSGATVGSVNEANIKRFNHWSSGSATGSYYQALYSTHITASTAVELMGVSFGYSISSSFYGATNETNKTEKNRIYKLHAKMLLGDENERFTISGSARDELIFLSFTKSQRKDELRKENITFKSIGSGSGGGATPSVFTDNEWTWSDTGASTNYEKTIRGDVADLVSGSGLIAGKVYYQAGVVVLVPELFSNTSSNTGNHWSGSHHYDSMALSGGGGGLDNTIDAMRFRIRNLSIINTTVLHSTLYFCRALNDEFNYSSNPTFLDSDKRILPTSGSNNLTTRTYITKVALYGENNEVLAVGALSEPLKKAPDVERTIVVRLDY